jgi:hypothetical protein
MLNSMEFGVRQLQLRHYLRPTRCLKTIYWLALTRVPVQTQLMQTSTPLGQREISAVSGATR